MSNIFIQKIKEGFSVLWPSFFVVVNFFIGEFLGFISDWLHSTGIFLFAGISILIAPWFFFIIQIYLLVKKYFLTEECQLFFIFYFLFFIFYFLFFIFYFLYFIFYPSSIQNEISSGLILIYQAFGILFLLSFLYEILLFKGREFIFKHIFILLAIISDFVLRYVFSGTLYLNIDSPYYQDNLFLISLVSMLILVLSFLTTKAPKPS